MRLMRGSRICLSIACLSDDVQDKATYHKDYPNDTNPIVNTSNGSNSSKTLFVEVGRDPAWDGPSKLDDIQDNATYHKDYPNDTHPTANDTNESKVLFMVTTLHTGMRDPAWDGPSKIDEIQDAEAFHKDFVSNDTGAVKNVTNGSKSK